MVPRHLARSLEYGVLALPLGRKYARNRLMLDLVDVLRRWLRRVQIIHARN